MFFIVTGLWKIFMLEINPTSVAIVSPFIESAQLKNHRILHTGETLIQVIIVQSVSLHMPRCKLMLVFFLRWKLWKSVLRIHDILVWIRIRGSMPQTVLRIRIRDRVLFDPWIRDPGSGIGFFRIPDLGSRIPGSQDHIFKSFLTIFLVKSSIILWKLAQIFFLSTSKLK